jgi:hypothetical protein
VGRPNVGSIPTCGANKGSYMTEDHALKEIQSVLLEMTKEGELFATSDSREDENGSKRVIFVNKDVASDEDREFTEMWLQSPYFEVLEEQ